MKVSLTRSGGFAGITETLAELDTNQLAPARAGDVEAAFAAAGFFDLPEQIESSTVGADLLRYEITAEREGRSHTVSFLEDESLQTVPLRNIVKTLTGL